MIEIAVVIPFFQRSPGIIERAIRSALRQELNGARLRIIVIDDASPIAADLPAPPPGSGITIELYRQANGGPGSARNTALDLLQARPPTFVAFLDSDDEWTPGHLARAMAVLVDPVDFYGADHQRASEAPGGSFLADGTIPRRLLHRLAHARSGSGAEEVFLLRGAAAVEAFVRNYLVQTSTIFYRWSVLGHLRFDPRLRAAGEDNLFWIECAATAREVAIDTALGVRCLDGVNIYEGASNWHGAGNVLRLGYLLLMWTHAYRQFGADPNVRRALHERRRNFEQAYSFMWARSLLKRHELNLPSLRMIGGAVPWVPPRLIVALCAATWRWIRTGQASFLDH